MDRWVADYSWARPGARRLADAGCIGSMRYLGPGTKGRDVTDAEIAEHHDTGLGVGFVWETTSTAALGGFKAGRYDFEQANRWADARGVPGHLPMFFAVDTDVTVAQARGPIADTFHGAQSHGGLRPCRPYGEADVLRVLCGEMAIAPCGWQCYAWSGGVRSPYRCLFQWWPPIWNGTVDRNELGPHPIDFLWHPDIAYGPAPEHVEDWLTMATIDEVRALVRQELDERGPYFVVVDGRVRPYGVGWVLAGLHKRWCPTAEYLRLLQDAAKADPNIVDLGTRGDGDPWIALLDFAQPVGPTPPPS